jgi:hypothetical protein
VNDASILLRDIAGDAAQKAASNVKPSEEQLSQIDQPAEDNTWHEKPDVAGMKSQLQSKMPLSKKDVKESAQDAADTADAHGPAHEEDKEGAKKGAKAGMQNLRGNVSSRFDDEQKEKMREYRERTNNYFKEKVPKERRDQAIFRLKKMIVEIQTHSDCRSFIYTLLTLGSYLLTLWTDQQAVETLLRLAEEYAGHGKHLANEGKGSAKGAHENDTLTAVETDLKVRVFRVSRKESANADQSQGIT